MNYKKIAINIISSGAQVAAVGILYFFLYKYLLRHLGVEVLGVWSVVLATSSLANLANFGVGTSVLRYVALYSSDKEAIKRLIFTSSIFLLLLFTVLSGLIYPFASSILKLVVGTKYLKLARMILPYSIACLILNEVAGIYASVLDGLQKNYIRSIIFTSSTILLFVITYFLTPLYGIEGVAIAQVAQCLFTMISCLITLKVIANYTPFKLNWDKLIFRQIFTYGMKFQFLSITGMLCDPVTKMLLAKFGGLGSAGFYEMASRLVNQVKGVIVNANQALVPVIVNISRQTRENSLKLYRVTIILVFYVAILVFSLVALFSREISIIWIGKDISFFTVCILLLCVSALSNLLCNPAYFSCIANGQLNFLIYSQILMAAGNLVFGLIGGVLLSGPGVVLGWVFAGSLSSIYLVLLYHRQNGIRLSTIISTDMVVFGIIVMSFIVSNYLIINYFSKNIFYTLGVACLILLMYLLRGFYIYKDRSMYFDLPKQN